MTESHDGLHVVPFDLTDTDRENLAAGDENFQPHNWEDLKRIIAANDLSILKRKPSDLLRYIAWTNETKPTHGSITSFVLNERLFWKSLPLSAPESPPTFICSSSIPFVSSDDYKILPNDWPYGISPEVTHLIAWSKIRLFDEKPEGYLTAGSVSVVEKFVERTFIDKLAASGVEDAEDRVLWFRNWTGLQSVKGLEHVHILVREAPEELLREWTNQHPA